MAASEGSTLSLLTVTLFTACVLLTVAGGSEAVVGQCEPKANTSRHWSFTLTRFHNNSGRWVEFASTREMDDELAVELTQQLFECGGRKMIRIQGALKDPFYGEKLDDRLKFHHMTGPNTALINKGYTVVKLKSGTWLLYGPNLWVNNANVFPGYSKISTYALKPGDRMGVMRSDTGALHFFINGVDQGPAASNIPEGVYGVYELYGDATQATILHP
ncbi:uncharacterized protein LOC124169281 isoform X2 [Ischnura elegans]|uniref:uncharacterized protein LOC124169281 isoform X2 n=1 Tax=Ischnura elegans TaxID=197161 RepID=UPI001ED87E64|nr:uncharacterized protein LOC124169281 isoform X2 [Ischnura elegans]